MKFNKSTRTFAMLDSKSKSSYIITNDETITFDNLDITKDRGWIVNTNSKTISPYLPIGVLTKTSGPWIKPDKQLNMDEVMQYKQLR